MQVTSAGFFISHASLKTLFQACCLPLPKAGLVLFAFRGCLPKTEPKGWVKAVEVESARVDYRHMRCTLGVWEPAKRAVFAAPGSTVPHADNVSRATTKGGKGVNQMEPGYYGDLTKGEHLQGKTRGHSALRQTANRFYRRAPRGLPFTSASPLFFGNPYE